MSELLIQKIQDLPLIETLGDSRLVTLIPAFACALVTGHPSLITIQRSDSPYTPHFGKL